MASVVRKPLGRLRARWLARLALERRGQIGPRAVQRREQAEEQARAEGEPGGKKQRRGVDGRGKARGRVVGQNRGDEVERPAGDEHAGRAAEQREQARLDKQLRDELQPARPEREPDGHLVGAPGGAREEQVGDVGARDDQHERGHAEEEQQRRSGFAVDRALPAPAFLHLDALGLEPGHRLVAHALLERSLHVVHDLPVRHVDRCLRLIERDAWLQARESVDPVGASIVEVLKPRLQDAAQGDGHEYLRRCAERRAGEVARRHADDRERLAVDDDGVVEHVRIGAEPRLPPRVAEHGDRRLADRSIVARIEEPPERGLHAEHWKVAS